MYSTANDNQDKRFFLLKNGFLDFFSPSDFSLLNGAEGFGRDFDSRQIYQVVVVWWRCLISNFL